MSYELYKYADLCRLTNDIIYQKEKHIIVKEKDGLFVLKYDKSKLNNKNEKTLGLFRSVIVDSKGRILSFAPPKSLNIDIFSQNNKYEDCIFQYFPEGTMINVFYDIYNDDWEIATRSNIGAKSNYNMDSKLTYRYMFLDAMNCIGMEFEDLDKNYCYSFVLQHPKNRIVCPILNPNIILTHRYKICDRGGNEYIELSQDTNDLFDEKEVTKYNMYNSPNVVKYSHLTQYKYNNEIFLKSIGYNGSNWSDFFSHILSTNLPYNFQGIVVYNKKGERTKLRNLSYEKIKHLKGNSPKLQYQYYHLRQQGAVRDFLKYYPEHKEEFSDLRRELHKWTGELYQNYISCFIKKTKPLREYPYKFKTHMFKLHEMYINNLKMENKFINKGVVIEYVNNLPPPRLMHCINYEKNQYAKDKKILTSDLKVLMK